MLYNYDMTANHKNPKGWGMARTMERVSDLCVRYPRGIGRLIMGDLETIRRWQIVDLVDAEPDDFPAFGGGSGRFPARYSHAIVLGANIGDGDLYRLYDQDDPLKAAAAFKIADCVLATEIAPNPEPPHPYGSPHYYAMRALFRLGDGPLEASLGAWDVQENTFEPAHDLTVLSFPLPLDETIERFPDIQRI